MNSLTVQCAAYVFEEHREQIAVASSEPATFGSGERWSVSSTHAFWSSQSAPLCRHTFTMRACICALLLSGRGAASCSQLPVSTPAGKWVIAFEDDFNGDSLNASSWTVSDANAVVSEYVHAWPMPVLHAHQQKCCAAGHCCTSSLLATALARLSRTVDHCLASAGHSLATVACMANACHCLPQLTLLATARHKMATDGKCLPHTRTAGHCMLTNVTAGHARYSYFQTNLECDQLHALSASASRTDYCWPQVHVSHCSQRAPDLARALHRGKGMTVTMRCSSRTA
jgi:hypothetical protein